MELKDQVQGVVIGLFGAYAGGYFADLTSQAETGNPVALVEGLVNLQTPLLGVNLSDDAAWVDTILGHLGVSSTSAAYTAAAAWANGELDAGASRAEVVLAAVTYLLGDSVEAQYASVATAFKADVAAGVVYSEGEGAEVLAIGDLREAAGNPATGTSFNLTTAAQTIFGEAGKNNVITGAAGTLDGDLIVDPDSTDSDVLNVTFSAADIALNAGAGPNATIRGVEAININIDAFDGTATTFDAANVLGATITLSSAKLGFNGVAGVENVGANGVTAGSNVTDLTVADLTTGVVNTGAATVASVTTSAATDTAKVTVNGNIDLTVATATTAEVTASAASAITLTAAAVTKLTVKGAGPTSVTTASLSGDEIVNGLTSGTLTAIVAGANADPNVDKWAVSKIQVSGNNNDLTNVGAAPIELTTAALTFSAAGKSATTSNVVISTAVNQASVTVTSAKTATVNATAAATIGTLNVGAIDTTVNASGNLTITTLTATGNVAFAGTGDVTITNATGAASIDATNLVGKVIVTTTGEASIVGGSGNNEVTIAASENASFTGQGGNDLLDASAFTDEILAATMGNGDDTVKLGALTTGTVVIDFGNGTGDKLWLADGTDLTNGTVTLSNLEIIEIENQNASTNDNTSVTVKGSTLSGKAYTVTTAEAGDTVTINVTADAATTDLSTLTLARIDKFVITGQATAETIKGTSTADEIIAGGGADVLTGGAGSDTFIFASGDSTQAAMAKITDFKIGEYDVLDIGVDTIAADVVSGDNLYVDGAADAADALGGSDVKAIVTDGILTLSGAAEKVAKFNTLGEWVKAALLVFEAEEATAAVGTTKLDTMALAFEFNGHTYVISSEDGATTNDTLTVDNIVELTGVTGMAEIGTAAAMYTIVLA